MSLFDLKTLPEAPDDIAPDGSEIRLLNQRDAVSLAHCTLPVGKVSLPVHHKTIEEIWFFTGGVGQVWRKQSDSSDERVVDVQAGHHLTIPTGAHFQFRNTGDTALTFIIATMPAWPGADEAVFVEQGKWQVV